MSKAKTPQYVNNNGNTGTITEPTTGAVPLADVRLVDYNAVDQPNVAIISGRVVNSGGVPSNPVILRIVISDTNNNILYVTTTSPEPSILGPGQEAPFSKQITSDELGYYSGRYNYKIVYHIVLTK